MRRLFTAPFLLLLLLAVSAGAARAADPDEAAIRGAVARALMFVEKEGAWWIADKKCVSCHHTAFLIWTHREAARRGFPVEEKKVRDWVNFAFGMELEPHEKGGVKGSRNLEGLAQMLLMPREKNDRPARETFANLLVEHQKADGSWGAGGQLPSQKRPKRETEEVSAMWMTLALERLSDEEKAIAGPEAVLERARKNLAGSKGGMSAEWAVMRMLLAGRVKMKGADRGRAIQIVKNWQRADGGWNWVGVPVEEAGDALATGMALWGLRQSGVPVEADVIRDGTRFLLESQRADGSWEVMSTKKDKKDEALATSVYWGTAWATIGLLACLPEEAAR